MSKQIHWPSDRSAETYAGRVDALLINHKRTNDCGRAIRERRTDYTVPLHFCHGFGLRNNIANDFDFSGRNDYLCFTDSLIQL